MNKILLPLSAEAVAEIEQQVTARGQGDRVGSQGHRRTVDLGEIVVIEMPEKMIRD